MTNKNRLVQWLIMDPTWGAGYVKDNAFVAKYTEAYFEPDMKNLIVRIHG